MSHQIIGKGISVIRGEKIVVQESDFEIPLGKITAIIGPNGSGKSTLLHAVAGLIPLETGSVELPAETEISYVMQYTAIPVGAPLTVREAVEMGRWKQAGLWRRLSATDKKVVDDAMQRLDIADLAKRHLSELSGGQRQRVYVSQGIAQSHNVLILDEPLTGLDLNSAGVIDDLIHDEPARGHTVILTTHDLAEAQAADYVILMGGKVIAYGDPKSVLTVANLNEAYGLAGLHHEHSDFVLPDTDPHHG